MHSCNQFIKLQKYRYISTRAHLPVEVSEFEVEETAGEAAEAQVRAEACRAGEQRVGIHSGTLKVGHPRLMAAQMEKTKHLDPKCHSVIDAYDCGVIRFH